MYAHSKASSKPMNPSLYRFNHRPTAGASAWRPKPPQENRKTHTDRDTNIDTHTHTYAYTSTCTDTNAHANRDTHTHTQTFSKPGHEEMLHREPRLSTVIDCDEGIHLHQLIAHNSPACCMYRWS